MSGNVTANGEYLDTYNDTGVECPACGYVEVNADLSSGVWNRACLRCDENLFIEVTITYFTRAKKP